MITLGDIYYIVFRHKWKILMLAALGVVGSMVLPMVWKQSYESEAKLLIKYVADAGSPTGPIGDGSRTVFVDASGRNIINTEMHILSSMDLAQEVATNILPAKIIGGEGSAITAAAYIKADLRVDNPDGSDIIRVVYRHKDPTVAQSVLTQVVKTYLEHHAKIYRPDGNDDIITAESDDLRERLKKTEADLTAIRTNLEIVSFEDSQKVFADEMNRLQQDIWAAQVDLAEHQATIEELSRRGQEIEQHYAQASGTNLDASDTNALASGTNTVAESSGTNAIKPVPSEIVAQYNNASDLIRTFRADKTELLKVYLPENSHIKDKDEQIATEEKHKKQLEQDYPGLVMAAVAQAAKPTDTGTPTVSRFVDESTRVVALQSKIKKLTEQLNYIRGRASLLDSKSASITELERTRKIEQEAYETFKTTQLRSSMLMNYGSKSSNINVIQNPSSPAMDRSKIKKVQGFLAIAGLALGLGLAFLIEMYIDRTVKRPVDIEAKLGVPLFLSIPYRNGKSGSKLLAAPSGPSLALRWEAKDRSYTLNGSKTTIGQNAGSTVVIDDKSVSEHHCEIFARNGEVIVKDLGSATGTFVDDQQIVEATLKPDQTLRVGSVEFSVEKNEMKAVEVSKKPAGPMPPWDPRHVLRPFYDTLRDRLITYFEVKNLTHNPKLVALTSCGDSAGVTSTAAGLAAALSETGEGNVLLVDMNVERGAAHHFYKGHLSCGIDEALKKDTRHEARVQDNLYVVTESNSDENSLQRVLPKRFTSLVPKLKASDYDYIIFDMPPMSQISITPRLARFMDMVMVVVESEKTDKEVVQRAVNMLTEARANVGVVLNKRKRYVPKQLLQEL